MPYNPVMPPRAEALRHSLTEALPVTNGYAFDGSVDNGLLHGVSYTKSCDVPSGILYDICAEMPVQDELSEELHERDPVVIYSNSTCITPDNAGQARAQAQLARIEADRLAEALATATAEDMRQSFPASDPHILASDSDPVSIQCALAMIDEWGDSWQFRPFVYAPRRTPLSRDWVWSPTSGDQLRTQSGARIALSRWFGNGPGGEEPPEDVAWIWATGPARILASNVVVDPFRNVKQNRYSWEARRAYVIDWACSIAAIAVEMPCPPLQPPPDDEDAGE